MLKYGVFIALCIIGLSVAMYFFAQRNPEGLTDEEESAYFGDPNPNFVFPAKIYHLGHSLVGQDMPFMLQQMAGEGHEYSSQLGGYATLQSHWEPSIELKGFDRQNTPGVHRDPKEALQSGEYDALVMTERIGLKKITVEAETAKYVELWANLAWSHNPRASVYVYETWFYLSTRWGWLRLIDWDLERYWEARIVDPAVRTLDRAIYIIPAGTVMAGFIRQVKSRGGVGGIERPEDLFRDNIHLNDHGAYLVALTHYAVIYGKNPIGISNKLLTANGSPMKDLPPEAAKLMQEVVWDVVTTYPRTGVPSQ